jgi:hypothetical protein
MNTRHFFRQSVLELIEWAVFAQGYPVKSLVTFIRLSATKP